MHTRGKHNLTHHHQPTNSPTNSKLLQALPQRDVIRNWSKVYCMARDGASLGTLMYKVGLGGGWDKGRSTECVFLLLACG